MSTPNNPGDLNGFTGPDKDKLSAYDFKLDLPFGEAGETYVAAMFKHLLGEDARVEVKRERKAFETGNFFAEWGRRKTGETEPKWTGVADSRADFWVIVFGTGWFCCRREDLLNLTRKIYVERPHLRREYSGDGGRTLGVLIPLGELMLVSGSPSLPPGFEGTSIPKAPKPSNGPETPSEDPLGEDGVPKPATDNVEGVDTRKKLVDATEEAPPAPDDSELENLFSF